MPLFQENKLSFCVFFCCYSECDFCEWGGFKEDFILLLIRFSAENGSLVIDLPVHLHYVVVSQIRSILVNFQLI